VGPELVEKFQLRLVAIAVDKKIVERRKLRAGPTGPVLRRKRVHLFLNGALAKHRGVFGRIRIRKIG
jgi:hypothetical protein